MRPLWLMMLRWRSATKMPRRTRRICEHQTPFGRFLKLRQPFGLPKRKRNMRQSAVRPWPVWRCRLDKAAKTPNGQVVRREAAGEASEPTRS